MAASRRVLNPKTLRAQIVRTLGGSVEACPGLASTTVPTAHSLKPKTLDDMDGPKGWPLVGNYPTYMKKENQGRLHEVQADLHKKYGPMFKEYWGPSKQFHTCDPEAIETIHRSEKKHPSRPPFNSWRLYRKVNSLPYGLVTGEGEDWLRIRQILSKKMLKPKSIAPYAKELGKITDDLMDRIISLRETGDEELSQKMTNEFYKWSMEAVGNVLFDTRLGCLNEPMPERIQLFINSINQMMSSSLAIIVGEKLHHKINSPFWRKHADAWDQIFEVGKYFIGKKLEEIKLEMEGGKRCEGGDLLKFMLANEKLTMDDMYVNVTEILLSGVDTTSNSLCFTLYLLSRHPEALQNLTDEIDNVVGDAIPTSEHFEKMPYLKAVLRESLRLYPVITMNVRVLEEDINVHGYNIPKKTLCVMNNYAASRSEEHFEKAEDFIPERWFRDGPGRSAHNPFTSLPFGFGNRSCIGKRIAHLELYLALTKICQRFKIQPMEGELKPYLRTLLTPGDKVPIRFVDR